MSRLLTELEKKYYSYGELKGTILLDKPNKEEIKAISSLGFVMEKDKFRITISKLLLALALEDTESLKILLEKALNRDLVYKKDIEEERIKVEESQLRGYLKNTKSEKLKKYLIENKQILKFSFFDELVKILDNIDGLSLETLGNFACRLSGKPHLLDYDSKVYKQLINYLKYLQKVEGKLSLEEEKNLLANFGLCQNPLNTNITVFAFRGYTNEKEYPLLKVALEEKEDISLNLSNIFKLDRVKPSTSKVLILENPNVYISIKEYIDLHNIELSLICTSGQLNQSAYIFLDKLEVSEVEVYYSGDIDPEGLLIAQAIKKRFSYIKLIAFDLDIYNKYKSKVKISQTSLKKLKNIDLDIGIEYELIKKVEGEGKPVYQELFYMEILNKVIK